jgi:hypothetical protein
MASRSGDYAELVALKDEQQAIERLLAARNGSDSGLADIDHSYWGDTTMMSQCTREAISSAAVGRKWARWIGSPNCFQVGTKRNSTEAKMGADLYLESLWEPFIKQYEKRERPNVDGPDATLAAVGDIFEDFRSSGGYFRNGYNAGDVMFAMGLSWYGTVLPMLDDSGHLPIDQARKLLAMIEERPLTGERLSQHYLEHMCNDADPHPEFGRLRQHDPEPWVPPDFENWAQFLRQRHEQLIVILRKSIALNEPLLCSL